MDELTSALTAVRETLTALCPRSPEAFVEDGGPRAVERLARALLNRWTPAYADEAALPRAERRRLAERVRVAVVAPEFFEMLMLECARCEEFVPFACPTMLCPDCRRAAN